MVKIDFEFDTPHGVFRDALHLPDDHAFTEDEKFLKLGEGFIKELEEALTEAKRAEVEKRAKELSKLASFQI